VTTNIGHGNKKVIEAMVSQANQVSFASRSVFENAPNKELARLLVALAGPAFDQAFIVSGGSEATEAAIKMARQYAAVTGQPSKWKVLSRNPSYHGATLGAVAVTGDIDSECMYDSVAKIMPKVPTPFSYRLPEGVSVEEHAMSCVNALEDAILEEGAESVLAFLIEPVGGLATGALVAPDSYYKGIRDVCTRYGILLIFDEVMSGAGRTGKFLSADHWPESMPDIVTLAKGVAAGYTPLGVLLAPNRIVGPIAQNGGFLHGHTYSANPLSCAIGCAVLKEMIDAELMKNATLVGEYLRNRLEELALTTSIVGDVRGKGLLLAIEIVQDKRTKKVLPSECRAVYRLLEIGVEKGILLYTRKTAGGLFGEWLMVTPSLTITKDEVDELIELLAMTLNKFEYELRSKGYIKD
jgi:adenosylmethionine-8-amino-7-oxononanoate aminotransferase